MVIDGSFLDGSVVNAQDSIPVSHSLANVQRRSISPARLGHSVLRPPEHTSVPGPPPIRRPLTPILSQPKNKLHPNPGQQTPQPHLNRKSLPSMRRSREGSSTSSASSSSSSSSTRNTASPNGSFHQRQRPSPGFPTKPQPIHSGPPISAHSSARKSSAMPSQTPIHHPSQHRLFHSTPAANPCSCCTNQPSHVPLYQNNTWQGTPAYPTVAHNPCGFHCGTESVPLGDHCISPSRQSLGCRISPTKSPVVPVHYSPSQGPCVSTIKGSVEQVPSCQAQCCQVVQSSQVACLETPMGLLPADAYKMLMDQERQLKLLQLQVCIFKPDVFSLTCFHKLLTDVSQQIQKLLESQSKTPLVSSAEHDTQQERANQTPTLPPKRTSVSVAVGTGALMEGFIFLILLQIPCNVMTFLLFVF